MFVFGYPKHNTGNLEVEVVSFLSHREGRAMVHNVGNLNSDWGKLQDDFCHSFSPLSPTPFSWSDILAFEQFVKESLGETWARFSCLSAINLGTPLPDEVLLHLFCMGLDMTSALDLDITAGGSFAYKTLMEEKKILDNILEKCTPSIVEAKTLQE
jgi:hypothetical protein